jgi:hypothetical protein
LEDLDEIGKMTSETEPAMMADDDDGKISETHQLLPVLDS